MEKPRAVCTPGVRRRVNTLAARTWLPHPGSGILHGYHAIVSAISCSAGVVAGGYP
jgi:hypothetical protein